MRIRSRTAIPGLALAAIGTAIACSHSAPAPAPTPAPSPAPTSVIAQGSPARAGGATAPANNPASSPARTPDTSSANPDAVPAAAGPGRGRGGNGRGGGAAPVAGEARAYASVITPDMKTRDGLFKVHRNGTQILFEIPRSELDKDQLLVSEIAQTTLGAGYGGQAVDNHLLRWERRDNRILLRSRLTEVVSSDTTSPVAGAVSNANVEPIIAAYPIEAWGPDSAPVIDVTRTFMTPPTELSPSSELGSGGQPDASRSFIEKAVAFPDNVNIEVMLTYAGGGGRGGAADPAGGRGGRGGAVSPSQTIVMSYSFHRLPTVPMKPRLCDNRVGYFDLTETDYSLQVQKAGTQCFITRYRLEKKDPNAALSEPVKPIVYYIDPNTPKKWVPWLKKAIEDWNVAFEAAGFKNAIQAREAPSPEEDPDWSPEDARYSVVDWLPSTTENASGPNVHDPRSGEIIDAHIQLYHNVQNLARTWYFTQVAALDPRARTFPLPDSLMGRLLEYVLCHEVGHTIGFQHNMKASSEYPIDSIRNASFVHRMGHTPSIMDYARFNYVAQPEDHIALEDLVPRIGPYDIWATHWGYAPIPGAATPDDERKTLDTWAREQDKTPWLRFTTSGNQSADPGDETEAVGDADAVTATDLGIKNLKREMPMIVPATVKPLDDFGELSQLYGRMLSQWTTEMGHVTNVIGGSNTQEKYGDQAGPRFTPVPRAQQKRAEQFIADNAFKTPTWLTEPDIESKLEPSGAVTRITGAENSVLTEMLNDAKIGRLVEWEATAKSPSDAYAAEDYASDLRHAIFSELSSSSPKIDIYRRALQRNYVDQVGRKVRPPAPAAAGAAPAGGRGGGGRGGAGGRGESGEIRALFRGELKDLDKDIVDAIPKTTDRATRAHLEDLNVELKDILANKAASDEG